MTISYNWLCDYFPDNLKSKPSPEQISRILTSIGLEVETLKPYYSIAGGLEGLVIGEVISALPHPNAEKLKITQVNIGGKENLQIVCGANRK
jgi:phenylalanyl-tRNA synthetase beta chain